MSSGWGTPDWSLWSRRGERVRRDRDQRGGGVGVRGERQQITESRLIQLFFFS